MEASFEKALGTLESIHSLFNPSSDSETKEKTKEPKKTKGKTTESVSEKETKTEDEISDVCFGFEDLNISPKMKASVNIEERTPERTSKTEELSSDKKRALEDFSLPVCTCVLEGQTECPSRQQHRLCISAGVAVAQFMLQAGNKVSVRKVLGQLKSQFNVLNCTLVLDPEIYFKAPLKQRQKSVLDSGLKWEPELLSSWLMSCCIQAELQLHQKEYKSLHSMWKMVEEMHSLDQFENVLHQTLLLSRLALSEASRHLLCSKELVSVNSTSLVLPKQTEIQEISTSLQDIAISMKKKVSFGDPNNTVAKQLKPKVVRDLLKSEGRKDSQVFATPSKTKKNPDSFMTPKYPFMNQVFANGKVSNVASVGRTPANRINDLAALISDNEDDIAFPNKKPITPNATRSVKSKSARARTQPKKSQAKGVKTLPEANIACKLDFLTEAGSVSNNVFVDPDSDSPQNKTDVLQKAGKTKAKNNKQKSTAKSKTDDLTRTGNKADSSTYDQSAGDSSILLELNSNTSKQDVYDFSVEASPQVNKTITKPTKKSTQTKKKIVKTTGKEQIAEPTNENELDGSNSESCSGGKQVRGRRLKKQELDASTTNCKDSVIDASQEKPKKRGRRKNNDGEVEVVRQADSSSDQELNVSIEPIDSHSEVQDPACELGHSDKNHNNTCSIRLTNPDLQVGSSRESFFEPIEVMRGDTNKSRKTSRSTRQKREKSAEAVVGSEEIEERDEDDKGGNGKEEMRSGRLCSSKEMSEKLGCMDEEDANNECVVSPEYGMEFYKEIQSFQYVCIHVTQM